MGFKFRKRIKIAPGLHVNISKSGVSTSIGKPGATVNIGKKGVNCSGTLNLATYSEVISSPLNMDR